MSAGLGMLRADMTRNGLGDNLEPLGLPAPALRWPLPDGTSFIITADGELYTVARYVDDAPDGDNPTHLADHLSASRVMDVVTFHETLPEYDQTS